MKFKFGSINSNPPHVWFTSDNHFGHASVIKHANRPFETSDEMNHAMVANWNSVVGKDDVVWNLGDFSFLRTTDTRRVIESLNGTIHFIKGNHDKTAWKVRDAFTTAQEYAEIAVEDQKIILFHYPMLVWNKSHYGSWLLCGHSHGSLNYWHEKTTSLDVGVDNFNFTPVSFEEIKGIMDKKTFAPFDHHIER